jgi:hypothetical protein
VRQSGIVIDNKTPISSLIQQIPLSEITHDAHSILIPAYNPLIPWELNGTRSYFPLRKPTVYKLENPQVHVTLDAHQWDHYDQEIASIELECQMKLGASPMGRNKRVNAIALF